MWLGTPNAAKVQQALPRIWKFAVVELSVKPQITETRESWEAAAEFKNLSVGICGLARNWKVAFNVPCWWSNSCKNPGAVAIQCNRTPLQELPCSADLEGLHAKTVRMAGRTSSQVLDPLLQHLRGPVRPRGHSQFDGQCSCKVQRSRHNSWWTMVTHALCVVPAPTRTS